MPKTEKDDLVKAINSLNTTLKNLNLGNSPKKQEEYSETKNSDLVAFEKRISRLEEMNEKFSSTMLKLIEKIEALRRENKDFKSLDDSFGNIKPNSPNSSSLGSQENSSNFQNPNMQSSNANPFEKPNVTKPLPRNLNPDLSNLRKNI